MNDDEQVQQVQQESPAIPDEQAQSEAAQLYKDLGIKAPVPSGKTRGRPKASDSGAKKDKGEEVRVSGRKGDSEDRPKDAPAGDKNRGSDDDTDTKASKKREADGEVRDDSEESTAKVQGSKSESERDSDKAAGKESDGKSGRDGQEEEQQGKSAQEQDDRDDEEDSEAPEGKRPGKSDPKLERRFQKLTSEVKAREQALAAREEQIKALQKQLEEVQSTHRQSKIAQEDPEYTLEDFRRVRDEEGNVLDLDENDAELAWRRWKDGYEERKAERESQMRQESELERAQRDYEETAMRQSAEAFDTLNTILDDYPELDVHSSQFDKTLSDRVTPLIAKMIEYQEGTEPGNEGGLQPVITGMRMNPKELLEVINAIRKEKRDLPLSGINDNVESRSNVGFQRGRSSDPTVNQANELYAELGIKKRM